MYQVISVEVIDGDIAASELPRRLRDGWEPFAVTLEIEPRHRREYVWLRRIDPNLLALTASLEAEASYGETATH